MTQAEAFWAELQQEAKATKAILESVPADKADWKPHEKSMSLGRLAAHVGEIPGWFKETLLQDELDFATSAYKPFKASTQEELLAHFEKNMEAAREVLSGYPDEKMAEPWTMRHGENIFFTLPKGVVARTWCLNHLYHHRAQLGVYLRLLDVPVPSTYGGSADSQ
ncbi:MAG: DinB family protein [Bacteroidota bacterium]